MCVLARAAIESKTYFVWPGSLAPNIFGISMFYVIAVIHLAFGTVHQVAPLAFLEIGVRVEVWGSLRSREEPQKARCYLDRSMTGGHSNQPRKTRTYLALVDMFPRNRAILAISQQRGDSSGHAPLCSPNRVCG